MQGSLFLQHSLPCAAVWRRSRSQTSVSQHLNPFSWHDASSRRSLFAGATAAVDANLGKGTEPDIVFTQDRRQLHVFGVCHLEQQAHIAAWILKNRPWAVIFETAVTPRHGSLTGNTFDCTDATRDAVQPYFVRWLCPLAGKLSSDNALLSEYVLGSSTEQLAYMATLAVGAQLVFGDRPKRLTYSRLLSIPSIAELDTAFGRQVVLNTRELLHGVPAVADNPAADPVASIMLCERDAVLSDSCTRALAACPSRGSVVAVVGEAHLPGMRRLLHRKHGHSSRRAGQQDGSAQSTTPLGDGVRRALVESVLRLQCGQGVLADFNAHSRPLPPQSQQDYETVLELYGTSRMLLAAMPKDLLQQVCQGWHCEMWDVLEPLRKARPIHGGNPADPNLILELRTLNFEID